MRVRNLWPFLLPASANERSHSQTIGNVDETTKEKYPPMRIRFRIFAAALAAASFATQLLPAQQQQQNPPIYHSTASYHVADENRAAHDSWLKDKFRRLVEGMMKEDSTLRGVTVTRVIYGGIQEPEANYYIQYANEGISKPRTALQNKVAQQLFGKSYADFIAEARPLRKRLGQILSRRQFGTPPSAEEGDIVRIDFKKIAAGRMGDYIQMERENLRLREAQVKAGKMKGWTTSTLVLPVGTEREFDAFTTHIAKDLAQSLNWNQGASAINAQLNPPVNMTSATMRANDLSKTVRGETRTVVMVVRRP